MEGITKASKGATSEAFAGLTEAYGLIAEIQGKPGTQGRTHARMLGLKFETELKAFDEMPPYERERYIWQRVQAAYDYMRLCCKLLRDARAKLIETERRCSGLKADDLELVLVLDACSDAEEEVKICEIAASVAEDDVLLHVKQLRQELHCIYENTKESQEKICRIVASMLVEMEAISKTAICVDTFDML